jgi:hypothetical protein
VSDDYLLHDTPVFCRAGYVADRDKSNPLSYREATFEDINSTYGLIDKIEMPFDKLRTFGALFQYHVTGPRGLKDELESYPGQTVGYVSYRCEIDGKNDPVQQQLRPLKYEWRNTSDFGTIVAPPNSDIEET